MTCLEILVEEPSMEAALRELLPRILPRRARFHLVNMKSKGRLLKKLPDRLKAYRKRIGNGEDLKIVVLVDRGRDDSKKLKQRLETMARRAGLVTKTSSGGAGAFQVVTRIAVEELEPWFMGDVEALRAAFPGLRGAKFPRAFEHPDKGGTWERLHRFLKRHNIYRGKYPKIEAARQIAKHMEPHRNQSPSFQTFLQGLKACL